MFKIADEVFFSIEDAAEAVLELVPINLFDNYLNANYAGKGEGQVASRVLRENNLKLYLETFYSWVSQQKNFVLEEVKSIGNGDVKTILGSDVVRLKKIS